MSIRDQILEYGDLANQLPALEAEIARLSELKKRIENSMAEIKAELKEQMLKSGKSKAIIAGWKLNISNSTSTVIEAEDELPEEFWRIERKPDLMKVKDAIKNGIHVDGARLVTNQNISLKPLEVEETVL